jgi:hypothetical protein
MIRLRWLAYAILGTLGLTLVLAGFRTAPQVKVNGCTYHAHEHGIGAVSSEITVTYDGCHKDMRAFTVCEQPPPLSPFWAYGVWRTNAGKTSQAVCSAHDLWVRRAGYEIKVPGGDDYVTLYGG